MKEEHLKEIQENIIGSYKDIVLRTGRRPFYKDFPAYNISRDQIRYHFQGIEELHQYFREHYTDFLNNHFSDVEDIFSDEKCATNFNKKILVITTAVADAKVFQPFLDSIDVFCKRNNAQAVIMPCESVTNSFDKKTASFSPVFNDSKYLFVSNDTPLNNNISLCSIQVSAKQIRPITGLSRIGNREGSYIFASPKQFLEYIPSGNSRTKNYAIMTPGACTLPNYYSDTFISKRLSHIAEHDHIIGAIIVEIEDDTNFHFRQIQADLDGSFVDLGIHYSSNGDVKKVPVNIIMGDIHGVQSDTSAIYTFTNFFSKMDIRKVFIHDIFDGYSVSHHIDTIYEKSIRTIIHRETLQNELIETYHILDAINLSLKPEQIFIVKSNHDEFLDRYLKEGRYVNDPQNHELALKIALGLFHPEKDLLQHAFETVGIKVSDHIKFLSREDSVKIHGFECGSHGDKGINGAKASLTSLEKIYGKCVVGHAHSPAIQRGVFRVGTLSMLNMGYNVGPSAWMQTCAILTDSGQCQLINRINNKCSAYSVLK